MFSKEFTHLTDYGVIKLPRWWPWPRCFAFGFIFLTPVRLAAARSVIELTVVHEAEHVKRQRRMLVLPWLVLWALSKSFRLDEEARGFAAAVRYYRDFLGASSGEVFNYFIRKADALHQQYWLGKKYSAVQCRDQIQKYL